MSDTQRSGPTEERTATFGEVLANKEFRALFVSDTVSMAGDMLSKVAVTFLVWNNTGSALAAGATFAISYAPYLFGAPILSALAERFPYRRTMIVCNVLQMLLIGAIAIPGMPLAALLALLFLSSMATPAQLSARSALLPKVLDGDAYVVGLSMQTSSRQIAQLAGFFLGGALTSVDPHLGLSLDAATFGLAALLQWAYIKPRPATAKREDRKHLLRETGEGVTFVFGHRVLGAIALLVFSTVAISIVPEGAAAPWTHHLGGGSFMQGALMASGPIGGMLGALIFARWVSPARRRRLVRPIALAIPVALIPALFDPPFPVVLVMAAVSMFFGQALIVILNRVFVQIIPDNFRARSFGVMQTGLMLAQGAAVLATGALAEFSLSVPNTVAVWGIAGVILVGLLSLLWPQASTIDKALEETEQAKKRAEEQAEGPPTPRTAPAQPEAPAAPSSETARAQS